MAQGGFLILLSAEVLLFVILASQLLKRTQKGNQCWIFKPTGSLRVGSVFWFAAMFSGFLARSFLKRCPKLTRADELFAVFAAGTCNNLGK